MDGGEKRRGGAASKGREVKVEVAVGGTAGERHIGIYVPVSRGLGAVPRGFACLLLTIRGWIREIPVHTPLHCERGVTGPVPSTQSQLRALRSRLRRLSDDA